MGLVDNWLEGIGLGYAVPIFAGQGINSPEILSELDVVDFPELGISNHNDRKKVNRRRSPCVPLSTASPRGPYTVQSCDSYELAYSQGRSCVGLRTSRGFVLIM